MSFREAFREYSVAGKRLEDDLIRASSRQEAVAFPSSATSAARMWMRAARSLQMAENWRAQAGTWEWLGNLLGTVICEKDKEEGKSCPDRYRPRKGREDAARFFVISDGEWEKPKDSDQQDYKDPIAALRHQRAWAFEWAGDTAGSASRHDDAARLYRRAGVSWEKSHHAGRYRRAADAYFKASLAAAQTTRNETRSFITEKYCPSCLPEKSTEQKCPQSGHDCQEGEPGEEPASDLKRLEGCWKAVQAECSADSPVEGMRGRFTPARARAWCVRNRETHQQEAAHADQCRQLCVIQRMLAVHGERKKAREVFRERQRIAFAWSLRRYRYLRYALQRTTWLLSRNGSDVGRFLASLAALYFLILPLLWWISGAVTPAEPTAVGGFMDSLLFSVSSMFALSTGYFEPGSWLVNLIQAMQALSAFFGLGYALWMAQRSYAD